MTSNQKSSNFEPTHASVTDVESLAGLFHPHAIEVQDFSYYALILDVRSQREFDDDHLPGAVRLADPGLAVVTGGREPLSAELARDGGAIEPLPPALAALVAPIKLDQAILVYCGRGGRDSLAVAKALRWRGWTVDVLAGGWINYRRWVQAGLETLPRLIAFRVVTASLGGEIARVLSVLSDVGEQVLDVLTIAGWRAGNFRSVGSAQPAQAAFESLLLQALRQIDPRRPVWVADVDRQLGSVSLPGALMDALAVAPTVALSCPLAERLARWREDESVLDEPVDAVWQAPASSVPATGPPSPYAGVGLAGPASQRARLLADRDEQWRVRAMATAGLRVELPPLVVPSFAPDRLLDAIEQWLPQLQTLERR